MPAKKAKTAATKSDPLEVPKRLKPASEKRKGRAVERFTIEDTTVPIEAKPVVIKKGKGKKLSDCPNVVAQINKRPKSDDLLATVHSMIFHGRITKGTDVKDNLLQFSGLVYEDAERDRNKLETRLDSYRLKPIRDALAFFGQDPEGERDDIVKRLADFLEKPKPSDEKYPISGDEKSSSKSSSKSKKDPNAPKRPLSSYMFFCKDVRDELTKKYPKESITEIAKRLGAQWSKLSSSDKKKYEAQAAKAKSAYEKAKSSTKSTSESSSRSSSPKKSSASTKSRSKSPASRSKSPSKKSDASSPSKKRSRSESPKKAESPKKSTSPKKAKTSSTSSPASSPKKSASASSKKSPTKKSPSKKSETTKSTKSKSKTTAANKKSKTSK